MRQCAGQMFSFGNVGRMCIAAAALGASVAESMIAPIGGFVNGHIGKLGDEYTVSRKQLSGRRVIIDGGILASTCSGASSGAKFLFVD